MKPVRLPYRAWLRAAAATLLAFSALLAPSSAAIGVSAPATAGAARRATRTAHGVEGRVAGAVRAKADPAQRAKVDPARRVAAESAYGRLPMSFVANEGQLDPSVLFSARGGGYQLSLTETDAVLALSPGGGDDAQSRAAGAALRMKLAGARRPAAVRGEGLLAGRVNYLVGDDPSGWRTGVATYSSVRYSGVYAGVDLVYYGSQRELEYDFRLAPGADARRIRISFEGARDVRIGAGGRLLLRASGVTVAQRRPVAYQIVGGARREVPARYSVDARGRVGFRLGAYERGLPLVIDPVISYATYLGGSATDQVNGIAVDAAGNAYLAGETTSTNFPLASALKAARSGTRDAFVTKLNPAGTALVYSTYIGGGSSDRARAIAVDAAGDVYLTGWTFSDDFPHTAGALQQSRAGGADAFVLKLSPSGDAILYSTYLGGNNGDVGNGIGVDSSGHAYVAGSSDSTIFGGAPTGKRGSPVYRSADAGASWSADKTGITDAALNSITVDPVDHNTLYAAGSVVFKSTDGGDTWAATTPLPAQPGLGFLPYALSVTVDPVQHSTLYVASPFGVFKSTDAGGSWSTITTGLEDVGGSTTVVLVDPSNHTTLYAASDFGGVLKSTDAGASWHPAYNGIDSTTAVVTLVLDPSNPSTIYAGTPEGVFKTTNAAATWSRANAGLPTDSVFGTGPGPRIDELTISASAPSTIYAYATDHGVYKSTNGGALWSATTGTMPLFGGVKHIAADPASASTVYAADSFTGLYKTTDGGGHWSLVGGGLANRVVNGVTVDPVDHTRVFVATNGGGDGFVARLNASASALDYIKFLGGDEDDQIMSVAVSPAGEAHVAGATLSSNFPTAAALQPASGGGGDAFVAKLTPAGALAYSTYLGGRAPDAGLGVALDGAGRAYVTGWTQSDNFPVTVVRKQPDPFSPASSDFYSDAFLARFSPDGSALDYSFLHGGPDWDEGHAVAADAAGNAYITGIASSDFPLFNAAPGAPGSVFVAKFDAAGNPAYSTTFLSGATTLGLAIAADNAGGAYAAGSTGATNLPVTASAFQRTRAGGMDGFVVKLQSSTEPAPQVRFSQAAFEVSEGAGRAALTVTRVGDASAPLTVSYQTVDDPAPVRCDDNTNNHGAAYARCDYATAVGTITFAAGDTQPKQINVPIVDDGHAEGDEIVRVRLFSPVDATLAEPSTATLTIRDNDAPGAPNPIFQTDFFVRQQYLDFLSREPEPGQPWSGVINNCPANDPSCDRISVSANFFRSQEFQLKGLFVFKFYKVAFGRLPRYAEIVTDMASVTGTTTAEVQQKKAAFTNSFAQRQEFRALYDPKSSFGFVDALMDRYGLQQITTPDPAHPDGAQKVTLTRSALANGLAIGDNGSTYTRAQIVRAIADSDEVSAAEFNSAFVAMQYFGYLRRDPEPGGYQAWLNTINANPNDFRSMVNGFMNSQEYRLRFGQP